MLVKDFQVNPNIQTRGGSTPLHMAATYGRREIYNDLLHEHGADPNIVDYAGNKAISYVDNLAHGANNKGINKIWQDLAIDIQEFQRKCFEDQQKRCKDTRNGQPKDPKCFEAMKKRHSIGF